MTPWTIEVDPAGTVAIPGMDIGDATLIAATATTLTVRVEGKTGWSGRGQRRYRPAHVIVYQIVSRDRGIVKVVELTSFPLRTSSADTAKAVDRFTQDRREAVDASD